MGKPRSIKLKWQEFYWSPSYTWAKDISPQLVDKGINESDILKCVYVIKAYGYFAVQYPEYTSPTLYIGEGNLKRRLKCHEKWLINLEELVDRGAFKILVCYPKVTGNPDVHKDLEAALILEFYNKCGSIPLINKQKEKRRSNYIYAPSTEINKSFNLGRGEKYFWAIKPMNASKFYHSYFKT
jgi:hypothetical protein